MQVSKMVQNPKIEHQHKPPFMPNKLRPTFRKLVQNCGFFVNGEISQKFVADPVVHNLHNFIFQEIFA